MKTNERRNFYSTEIRLKFHQKLLKTAAVKHLEKLWIPIIYVEIIVYSMKDHPVPYSTSAGGR
jgi:hypothetical protein